MKIIFLFILVLHALIHLAGFLKGFRLAEMKNLNLPVSKGRALAWLLATLVLLSAAFMLVLGRQDWWIIALVGVLLSQVLITLAWKDARYGTFVNLLLLVPLLIFFLGSLPSGFRNKFRAEVEPRLSKSVNMTTLTEQDISALPLPVNRYLHYTGAVGRPKVRNFFVFFKGRMRSKMDGKWMEVSARQVSFFDDTARFFYIRMKMFGIPVEGLHSYSGSAAIMKIRAASLYNIADAGGEKMNRSETVTMLNDMCLLAPSTLISPNIRWETIDSLTVRASFINKGNRVSAILTFNQAGALVNFSSEDRFESADGKHYESYPWSTPVLSYGDFNGIRLPSSADAIWQTPKGPFVYAHFDITGIRYNISKRK